MARIFWTEEEEEVIIKQGVEAYFRNVGLSLSQLLTKAQNCAIAGKQLAPSRKRPSANPLNTKWFEPRLKEAVQKKLDEWSKPKIVRDPIRIDEISTDDLMREVVRRFTPTLHHAAPQVITPQPAIKLANKENQLRIGIVGLLPNQVDTIKNKYGCKAKLMFMEADRFKHMSHESTRLDCIITMTKFISHAVEASVKKFKNCDHVRITGGMSTLQDTLDEMICCAVSGY